MICLRYSKWSEWRICNHSMSQPMLELNTLPRYGTAQDITYLADVLPMYLGVSVSKWGVAGISLGGHTALLSVANGKARATYHPFSPRELLQVVTTDNRFSVCVCIIGCGDYKTLMHHRASSAPSISAYTTQLNEQLIQLLSRVDPINNLDAFKGRALLFLGGEKDILVPPTCNQQFFEGLKTVYSGEAEKFEIIVEKGVGHEVTGSMEGRCVEWVNRWIFR